MKSGFRNKYTIEHWRDGVKIWEDEVYNLVVNEGLDDVLSKYFKGVGYTAQHFMGLKGTGAVAAGDTLAKVGNSQTAWNELQVYLGDRSPITLGSVSNQAVNNNATRVQFTIANVASSSGITVAGIMVTTVATGYNGVLFGAVDFSVPRQVLNGDLIAVAVEFTQASV